MISVITSLVSVVRSFLVFVLPVLILPIMLVVLIPLIDKVLSSQFVGYFTDSIGLLNSYIGTIGYNLILVLLGFTLFLYIFRFFMSIITSRK